MSVNLIGISGKAGSGKNTVASFLQDIDPSFEQKAFAAKLKEVASILTGVPAHRFEDQEFKKETMPEDWWREDKPTYRQFLQEVGTDALRNVIHPNIWVNALFADWRGYSRWIITDVRFPNEYKAIKDKGGIIVRVDRPGIELMEHPSETLLDDHEFDYLMVNDGDIHNLFKQTLTFHAKIIV